MLPGDFLQVSTSWSSVAQGIDDNSKGVGPWDRSRVSPALGATLVAHITAPYHALNLNISNAVYIGTSCTALYNAPAVPNTCT
jgi:hypothetical protein